MMRKTSRWSSIRVKITVIFIGTIVPLMAFLLYYNAYTSDLMRREAETSYETMLSYFVNETDINLENIDHVMLLQYANDTTPFMLFSMASTQSDYAFYRGQLARQLFGDLIVLPCASGCFIYSTGGDKEDFVLIPASAQEDPSRRDALREAMIAQAMRERTAQTQRWQLISAEGEDYLVRSWWVRKACIGAYVNTSHFANHVQEGREDIAVRFLTQDQNLNGQEKAFFLDSPSNDYGVRLSLRDKTALRSVPLIQQIMFILSYCLVAVPLVMFMALKRVIINPIRSMEDSMRHIAGGNMGMRIPEGKMKGELSLVVRTFNGMMDELETLKIHYYEEKMTKLQLEMECLHAQMDLHFFLGTLHSIYLLAGEGRTPEVMHMTNSLMGYLRSMFENQEPLVMLSEEVRRVRGYVDIQRLRLSDRLQLCVDVPDYLEDARVPTMAILTFVENSVKHARHDLSRLIIHVHAELEETQDARTLVLSIEDNGAGFSPEALAALTSGEMLRERGKSHVGIRNVMARMHMIYREEARAELRNGPEGGACVQLYLPYQGT